MKFFTCTCTDREVIEERDTNRCIREFEDGDLLGVKDGLWVGSCGRSHGTPRCPASKPLEGEMDLTVSIVALRAALEPLATVAKKPKDGLAFRGQVLIDANEDGATLTVTDLETTERSRLFSCEVEVPGRIVVPYKELTGLIGRLPDDTNVTLSTVVDGKLGISCEQTRAQMNLGNAENFPPVLEVQDVPLVEVPAGILSMMVSQALTAVSTDDTRYFLCGALFEGIGNTLRVVSTDGRRIVVTEQVIEGVKMSFTGIVPTKALKAALRLCSGTDSVALGLDGNHVVIKRGYALTVQASLISGDYPAWRNLLPESYSVDLVIRAEQLEKMIGRLAVLSDKESRRIRLLLVDDKGTFVADGRSEHGSIRESAIAEIFDDTEDNSGFEGLPLAVGVNHHYLLQAVKSVPSFFVRLSFTEPLRPFIVAEDPDEGEPAYRCLIMPMRLDDYSAELESSTDSGPAAELAQTLKDSGATMKVKLAGEPKGE
jgi:DNA polymerase-3 subunit beta